MRCEQTYRYLISTARQKLNSIQLLLRGGSNIISFLEVLHGEADFRIID